MTQINSMRHNKNQCVPIYQRIAVICGTLRGFIIKGPRSRADWSWKHYVIGIAMILSADLSHDESAANDRESEYSHADVKQLIVKRQIRQMCVQLHFRRNSVMFLHTLLIQAHEDSRRCRR